MTDNQKSRADFVRFWEAEILPALEGRFFLIENVAEIKNLCFLTWLESSKQNE
jgi:hemolysin-activating ACP:hemolysin acyltransferase